MTELNGDDLLFGYLPDDGYNPDSMKQGGFYAENLSWRHDDLACNGLTPPSDLYDGPGLKLHPQIGTKFNAMSVACGIGGGFTYDLMKCITANSNACQTCWW